MHIRTNISFAIILLKVILLAGFLVACHPDIDDNKIPEPIDSSIDFSPNITTRAISESTDATLKSSGFKVWGGYQNVEVFDGDEVTYDSSIPTWTYGSAKYWTRNTYSFHAVHPQSVEDKVSYDAATGALTISDYNIKGSDVDLLVASTAHTYPGDGESVPLVFRHAFAQVSFLAKKDELAGTIKINNIVMYGMPSVGTYETASEQWGNFTYTTNIDNTTIFAGNKSGNLDVNLETAFKEILGNNLVFPAIVGSGYYVELIYTITGQPQKKVTYQIAAASEKWEAGKKYTYTFTIIDPNTIVFDPPKITPWTEANGNVIIIE